MQERERERETERVLNRERERESAANLSNLLLAFIINRDFPFISNHGRTCNAL